MCAAGPMARSWSATLRRRAVASPVRDGRVPTRSLSAACSWDKVRAASPARAISAGWLRPIWSGSASMSG